MTLPPSTDVAEGESVSDVTPRRKEKFTSRFVGGRIVEGRFVRIRVPSGQDDEIVPVDHLVGGAIG